MNLFRVLLPSLGLLALAACQSAPPPKGVKIGKPYSVMGKTYYPAYDPTYDETGIASWYGPGFHGKQTANGESFNKHDLTAAHPTLPMPSLVRVTNLETGKAIVVRINDRGPFAKDRIIDLSRESAQRLGIHGLAKVRVQYLSKESEEFIAARNEGREIDMFAYNEQLEAQKNASILAATAPSDQTFIIEEANNSTQYGEVSNAAPVMSVSGADLPSPASQSSGGVLVRQAWADEMVAKEAPAPAPQRGGEVVLRAPNVVNDAPVYAKTAATKPPASGHYIQVGSFSQRENAQKMENKIASVAPVDIGNVDIAGNQWWRVRAGPFTSYEDAENALNSIRGMGIADARIMRQ